MVNSYSWKRFGFFSVQEQDQEQWILEIGSEAYRFDVNVRFGKKIDLVSIKREWPYKNEIDLTIKKLEFFREKGEFIVTETCPVCGAPKEQGLQEARICGMDYLMCSKCSHVYARCFPEESAVERYYRENVVADPYYMNPQEIELRLKEIYFPKISWITEVYRNTFGRRPESILDIGAGSGHFLFGCKRKGFLVEGIEFSRGYRNWCREQFGIELHEDVCALEGIKFDVVCSFNVIEHVYNPREFISHYKRFMKQNSLAVIETPKVNSLTTHLQKIFPDEPSGILIPYEHNHLFTDASLASLLFESGLSVKSVWYFGQDIAELILRICTELDVDSSKVFGRIYGGLQEVVDAHHASNLMLFAAAPGLPQAEPVQER